MRGKSEDPGAEMDEYLRQFNPIGGAVAQPFALPRRDIRAEAVAKIIDAVRECQPDLVKLANIIVALSPHPGPRVKDHTSAHLIVRMFLMPPPRNAKAAAKRQKTTNRLARKPGPKAGFYYTDEWRNVRYVALQKAAGRCQCCGRRPTKDSPLHVDHIKPRSKFPDLALDPENLQVLCKPCNLGKGNRDQTDWRPPPA